MLGHPSQDLPDTPEVPESGLLCTQKLTKTQMAAKEKKKIGGEMPRLQPLQPLHLEISFLTRNTKGCMLSFYD